MVELFKNDMLFDTEVAEMLGEAPSWDVSHRQFGRGKAFGYLLVSPQGQYYVHFVAQYPSHPDEHSMRLLEDRQRAYRWAVEHKMVECIKKHFTDMYTKG